MQFMAAFDVGDVFPVRGVATVESAEVIAADPESSPHADAQLTRLGPDDVDAGIGRAERRSGQRPAVLLIPPEPGVEQKVGAGVVGVGHGDILHPYLVAAPVYLQQIRLGVEGLLVEIRKEVAERELVVASDIVPLQHELVVRPMLAGPQVSDLLRGSVGERDGVQEVL